MLRAAQHSAGCADWLAHAGSLSAGCGPEEQPPPANKHAMDLGGHAGAHNVHAHGSSSPTMSTSSSGFEDDVTAGGPSLLEIPRAEWAGALDAKARACCVLHDFEQTGEEYRRARDAKTLAMCELVQVVGRASRESPPPSPTLSAALTDAVLQIFDANALRVPAPRRNPTGPAFSGEDDEPVFLPDWPHVHLAYDMTLRLLESTTALDTATARARIDASFVRRLMVVFDSEDPREREMAKTVLHRVYGKFLHLRTLVRRAMRHVFYEFLQEDRDVDPVVEDEAASPSSSPAPGPSLAGDSASFERGGQGQAFFRSRPEPRVPPPVPPVLGMAHPDERSRHNVAEILEVLASIVNGFALPLREEHRQMLVRTLLPMHRSRHLNVFFAPLALCVVQFVEKEPHLLEVVLRRGLLRYWPRTSSTKEVLFVAELEDVLEAATQDAFAHVAGEVARRLARCLSSEHFQVVERALHVFANARVVGLLAAHAQETYAAVLAPLLAMSREFTAPGTDSPPLGGDADGRVPRRSISPSMQIQVFAALRGLMDAAPGDYERVDAVRAHAPAHLPEGGGDKWRAVEALARRRSLDMQIDTIPLAAARNDRV